jgi:hypothetical protein
LGAGVDACVPAGDTGLDEAIPAVPETGCCLGGSFLGRAVFGGIAPVEGETVDPEIPEEVPGLDEGISAELFCPETVCLGGSLFIDESFGKEEIAGSDGASDLGWGGTPGGGTTFPSLILICKT